MARCLAHAVIIATLAFTVLTTRIDFTRPSRTMRNRRERAKPGFKWALDNLRFGRGREDPKGPLIPELVPGPGQTFEVMSREAFELIESNAYHWNMVSVTDKGKVFYPGKWFAQIDGSFLSNIFGYKTTVVNNNQGRPLFTIHMAKHMFNPTRLTWSFRIAHPDTGKVLYTINKDWFGTGLFWSKDEWRIYRGHKSDGEEIYYCVSSYTGYDHYFYHSKSEYKNNTRPAAEMTQSLARDFLGLPDAFTLKVHEGEDTALLLATTVILDMVHEQEKADARAAVERSKRKARRARARRNWESDSFVEQDSNTSKADLPDDVALLEQQAEVLVEQRGCPTGCSWRCTPGCMVKKNQCKHWPSQC